MKKILIGASTIIFGLCSLTSKSRDDFGSYPIEYKPVQETFGATLEPKIIAKFELTLNNKSDKQLSVFGHYGNARLKSLVGKIPAKRQKTVAIKKQILRNNLKKITFEVDKTELKKFIDKESSNEWQPLTRTINPEDLKPLSGK